MRDEAHFTSRPRLNLLISRARGFSSSLFSFRLGYLVGTIFTQPTGLGSHARVSDTFTLFISILKVETWYSTPERRLLLHGNVIQAYLTHVMKRYFVLAWFYDLQLSADATHSDTREAKASLKEPKRWTCYCRKSSFILWFNNKD